MPVGDDHGIKLFFPPNIDMPKSVVFTQCQLPSILPYNGGVGNPNEILNSRVELQIRLQLVH